MRWVMKDESDPGAGVARGWRRWRAGVASKTAGGRRRGVGGRVKRSNLVLVPAGAPLVKDDLPPGVCTAWCGDAATLRAAMRAGTPVMVVPGQADGTAVLDHEVAEFGKAGPEEAAVVRVGSSEAAPLSVGQVVGALGGAAGDAHDDERDGAALKRVLVRRGQGTRQLLVVVDGAETAGAGTLSFLRRLPGCAAGAVGAPEVRVAFAGGPGLYMQLADERIGALRAEIEAAGAGSVKGAVKESAEEAGGVADGTVGRDRPFPRWVDAGVAVMLLGLVAVGTGLPHRVATLFGGVPAAVTAEVPQAVAAVPVVGVLAGVGMEGAWADPLRQRRDIVGPVHEAGGRHLPLADRGRARGYLARHPGVAPRGAVGASDRRI